MRNHSSSRLSHEAGFTLIEVMVTTVILLVVSGVVINGVLNMTQLNATVVNRSGMFAGVRNATALLQQEVGQAGRISLPGAVTVTKKALTGENKLSVDSTEDMFEGEYLVIGTGDSQETMAIAVGGIGANELTFTETFEADHAINEPVTVQGAFLSGVVPKHDSAGNDDPNGSSDTVLKIFGDINGSGKMVYVEYTCDLNANVLYRNQMDFDAGAKLKPDVEQILVENVQPNPDNVECFKYQEETIGTNVFVIGVAITLTVRSEKVDPVTKQYQQESKALLNVSPRNVFNAWQNYSLQVYNRVQPTPAATAKLLPALTQ